MTCLRVAFDFRPSHGQGLASQLRAQILCIYCWQASGHAYVPMLIPAVLFDHLIHLRHETIVLRTAMRPCPDRLQAHGRR